MDEAMSTPIESISDDVLALIFECCSEPGVIRGFGGAAPYEGMPWTNTMTRDGAPFEVVATRVTRRWRDVAINLAPLWSNIYISPFQSPKRLEIYLTRSRKALLDIYFMLDSSERLAREDERGVSLALGLTMLVPHVDRWRLCIVRSYSYPTIKQIITAIHHSTAPNLEHFVMYLWPSQSQGGLSCSELFFQGSIFTGGAPRLRYFECIGASIESCWPPTDALTDLRLIVDDGYEDAGFPAAPLSPDRFIELLSSTPALTNLKLRGVVVGLEHTDSVVELPHLTSLAIDFDGDDFYTSYASNLCTVISCPAVTFLKLYQMTSSDTIDDFVSAMKKSPRLPKYPALTHLEIDGATYFNIDSNFLVVLPTVTQLILSKCTAVPRILEKLAKICLQLDVGIPWPNLQSLTIDWFYPYWSQALRAFLVARIEMDHPLQKLRLSGEDVDINKFLKEIFENT